MSSGSLALNVAAQDGALMAERVETKYLVAPERLPALRAPLAELARLLSQAEALVW